MRQRARTEEGSGRDEKERKVRMRIEDIDRKLDLLFSLINETSLLNASHTSFMTSFITKDSNQNKSAKEARSKIAEDIEGIKKQYLELSTNVYFSHDHTKLAGSINLTKDARKLLETGQAAIYPAFIENDGELKLSSLSICARDEVSG
jgi:hypothetical protein